MRHIMLAALLCLSPAQPFLATQEEDPEIVLIRNVRLVEREGQAEEEVVSILIKDHKLEVVTKDEIPAEEATRVFDAQQGVLLGKLHIGEPASFLILVAIDRGEPPVGSLDEQTTGDVFYRLTFSQNLALTPSVQWLSDPALNAEESTVWVFGLRARLSL